ncbi:MAG: ABC transporter permease, partial [Oscillospiraceae bacterium]
MNRKKKYIPYIPWVIVTVGLVYIQVMCDLKLPSYLIDIVNLGVLMQNMDVIFKLGAEMLGFTLIGMAAAILVSLLASRISSGISRDLRGDVFEKVENFSMHEFDTFSTASLITRSTNDIQQIQMFIFIFLRMITMAPLMAIGGIIKAVETSKEISWLLAVAIPVTLGFIFFLMIFIIPFFNKIQKYTDKLNKVSRESLTGIRVIRAFRNEKIEEEKFDDVNSALTKTNIRMNRLMSLLFPVTMLFINVTQIGIIWFGAKAVDAGNMQVGNIAGFINYAMQVLFSFLMLTMASVLLPRAVVSWKRIYAILKTKPEITSKLSPLTLK